MPKLTLNSESFIKILMYRLLASILAIISFLISSYIAQKYFDASYYAGWVGLIGAVVVLIVIRINLGSFKMVEKFTPLATENINVPQSLGLKNSQSPSKFQNISELNSPSMIRNQPLDIPQFNVQSLIKNDKTDTYNSLEDIILEKINLIEIKQQKLDGMKNAINPRVYDVLKRQYSMEKEFLLDDLTNERHLSNNQTEMMQSVSKQPSAIQPEFVSSKNTSNEDELLDRFKRLDKFLSGRLDQMKSKSDSSKDKEKRKKDTIILESST